MARPNVRCSEIESESSAILPEKKVVIGGGGGGNGEVAERQARAIIRMAKRALEEEEEAGGGEGKLSMKRSMEWFLETRRKRMAAAADAGVHRGRAGECGSSSSCSN
ncbi:hypothetical protein OsI_24166 [Oryza sativa Indica Group]|uniref:Uncharacterized protein n=1 Tax=Oryza sativa subsp. indica TaxID=39946 RepID=A2YG73_ORYSI|nr:hypothetical protein OsI_24166 [Oryza sativa Indica Group]